MISRSARSGLTAASDVGVLVTHHNSVLQRSMDRALELEEKLAAALEPVLKAAGVTAARAFGEKATDHLNQLAAAAGEPIEGNSTMVALKPRPEEAATLGEFSDLDPSTFHVTLAYLGQYDGDLQPIADALRPVAANHAPLQGRVAGVGAFVDGGNGHPVIALPSVPGLVELRVEATQALQAAGIGYAKNHGYQPHLTLTYSKSPEFPDPGDLDQEISFGSLHVVRGDSESVEVPLTGQKPLTASGARKVARFWNKDGFEMPPLYVDEDGVEFCVWNYNLAFRREDVLTAAGEPPTWTAPAADEILPIDELTAGLRGVTDPVRMAAVETTMKATLDGAGISFDATNPLTAKVLAQSGSQIKDIAQTTQVNVMKIIQESYKQGYSIPDTAKAIQRGMAEASPARARLIARTEMVGAVQGGSLAATQLVEQATGVPFSKRWMTAPGAPYPRHEDYPDLDGQTVDSLDGTFEVGAAQLQYPGDPDGPPEEICNCVVGETKVETPGLRAATRRWYEGDLVRVRLASGDELAATPNHPVLRTDGRWVPIGEVEEGDDLVGARVYRNDVGTPDPDAPPTEIREVYRLARVGSDPERVRVSPTDFHGDATDGEVDVVPVDGKLLLDEKAATDKQVAQVGSSLAYAAAASASDGTWTLGDLWGDEVYASWMPSGFVRGGSERATLVSVQVRHPDLVGVGAGPYPDLVLAEALLNDGSADPERSTDREDGFAALVTIEKVAHVDVESFHGFVYNLDTGFGWYSAGSLACGNCRCSMAYLEGGEEVLQTNAEDITTPGEVSPGMNTEGEQLAGVEGTAPSGFEGMDANDTVSVNNGPFVDEQMRAKIQDEGLDLPFDQLRPRSEVGRELFSEFPDTQHMYAVDGKLGTYTDEREKLHSDIINAYFEGKTPPSEADRVAYLTAGGGAAGKSGALFNIGGNDVALVRQMEEHPENFPNFIHIDPDAIKRMLPEFKRLNDAGDTFSASAVHEESSDLAKIITQKAIDEGYSYLLDTTGSSAKFIGKIEQAKAAGYDVKLSMVSVKTNEAIVRAMERGAREDRYVNIVALKDAHRGASMQIATWQNYPGISEWRLYDNLEGTRLVAYGGNGVTHIVDQKLWDATLAKANEVSRAAPIKDAALLPPETITLSPPTPRLLEESFDAIPEGPTSFVDAAEMQMRTVRRISEKLSTDSDFLYLESKIPPYEKFPLGTIRGYQSFSAQGSIAVRPGERAADALWTSWIGKGEPGLQSALQEAARMEFGGPAVKLDADALRWTNDARAMHGIREYLHEVYAGTQEYLRNKGVTEVRLYRGLSFDRLNPYVTGVQTVESAPLSSWSNDFKFAKLFADGTYGGTGENGTILGITVPADRIVGLPATGLGDWNTAGGEVTSGANEVVISGGTDQVSALSWSNGDVPASLSQKEFEAAANVPGPAALDRSSMIEVDGPMSAPYHSPLQVTSNQTSQLDSSAAKINDALTSIGNSIRLPDDAPALSAKVVDQVVVGGDPSAEGVYRMEERAIEVKRLGDPYAAFVHEFGHYLDNVPDPAFFASNRSDLTGALEQWTKVVSESPTYQRLRSALDAARTVDSSPNALVELAVPGHADLGALPFYAKTVSYVTSPRELWARAFVQWMAERDAQLGTEVAKWRPETVASLEDARRLASGWYWPPEEFKPISDAITAYFAEMGWLLPVGR